MGLFDKLKNQALNSLNELQDKVNNAQNQQQPVTPTPKSQMTPPPEPQSSQSGNSEGIYGSYMEHLIDMALADGELTEKEKQVLFKKAEANGIDLDEFEMVLDARLYEKQKTTQTNQPTSQIAASYDIKCPGTMSSFNLLSSKLEELENKKKDSVWGMVKDEIIDSKKVAVINDFPIPTTKEDILEFISMAAPLGKPATRPMLLSGLDYGKYGIAKAWRSKSEQAIMKARLFMKDDPMLEEIEKYAKILKIK